MNIATLSETELAAYLPQEVADVKAVVDTNAFFADVVLHARGCSRLPPSFRVLNPLFSLSVVSGYPTAQGQGCYRAG